MRESLWISYLERTAGKKNAQAAKRKQQRECEEEDMMFDGLSKKVLGCALEVHRELGPGLLESAYEQCLAYELNRAKIPFN